MDNALLEFLQSKVSEEFIFQNEPLSKHTTFRVGGEADLFVDIDSVEALSEIIRFCKKTDRNYFILGNGSNLLVSDKGYRGLVIHIGNAFSSVEIKGDEITAKAGALLSTVAKMAAKEELTGMEFASGIPGTIGGAMVMNAGAYDGEMKMITESVTVMNDEGELMTLNNDSMEFGYRTSAIKNRPFVVVETKLKLSKGNAKEIQDKMDDFKERRVSKQPLEYPSAGSTFKRPEGNFAGKLIMDAGLRGFRIGGAQVSEKHCGFVINNSGATASDIHELMLEVTEKVEERFGVTLEPEVIRVGEF